MISVFWVFVRVIQDGTAGGDYSGAVATDGDGRVLLAGFTNGNWSGVDFVLTDFVAVLLERPTTTPSPVTTTRTPPPSIAAGSSSSTATSTVTWTMAVVAAVAILVLAGWIWRRNKRRKGEGSQGPRSGDTTKNPDNYSKGNPTDRWGSTNPVHSDAPPPYNSVSASGGRPVGEIMPVPTAPPAGAIESTNPEAALGHGCLNEFKSGDDQDHVTPENHFVETISKTENSANSATLGTGLPPNVPRAHHEPKNTLENAAEDVTGSTDNRSSSGSSLHSGISVAEAVMEAAIAVAHSSNIPGVPETAMLVSLLVKLVVDHSNNDAAVDRRVRWCRSIVSVLKRASELFGKVRVWNWCNPNNDCPTYVSGRDITIFLLLSQRVALMDRKCHPERKRYCQRRYYCRENILRNEGFSESTKDRVEDARRC